MDWVEERFERFNKLRAEYGYLLLLGEEVFKQLWSLVMDAVMAAKKQGISVVGFDSRPTSKVHLTIGGAEPWDEPTSRDVAISYKRESNQIKVSGAVSLTYQLVVKDEKIHLEQQASALSLASAARQIMEPLLFGDGSPYSDAAARKP